MLRFLYTGNFAVGNPRVLNAPTKLLDHAKMYAFAEIYDIQGLKTLALERFAYYAKNHWTESVQWKLTVVEKIYTSTPPSDRGLRDLVAEACRKDIGDVMGDDSWRELMDKCEDLRLDMMNQVALRVKEDESKINLLDKNVGEVCELLLRSHGLLSDAKCKYDDPWY